MRSASSSGSRRSWAAHHNFYGGPFYPLFSREVRTARRSRPSGPRHCKWSTPCRVPPHMLGPAPWPPPAAASNRLCSRNDRRELLLLVPLTLKY
jgi:hypothetical protein